MKSILVAALLIVCFTGMARAEHPAKLKAGYLIAISEEAFSRCRDYIRSKDNVAFMSMVQKNFCSLSKDVDLVYVIDTKVFDGTALIRANGSTAELWTQYEAVK